MHKNKIAKIGLSLLIALAFIMPINAIANETKVIGSSELPSTTLSEPIKGSTDAPLQFLAEVDAIDIVNFTDPMATGCYPLTVGLHKENIEPIECDIKIFLDIWKQEEPPAVEIACYDFEDVGEIYNYWEAWDGPSGDASSPDGAIDTWSWSDARSCSPSHSMHSSMFDTYLGNQNDYLVLHQPIDEDYTDLRLTFCHWMEGEVLVIDEDGTEQIVDYGKVQYSWDGVTWVDISPLYYDNATADTVELDIPGASGQDDVWIRFVWHSNPCCQFEGWYIDDVCLFGFEDLGWGTRVFDTYTPHAITVPADAGYFEYTFDDEYCFEEGDYCIRVWILSETPECTVSTPQADPLWFCFTVDDIYDIAVTYNSFYLTDSPCLEGGDLMVEGTVCNVGTLDATNVQVTFTVTEQISETVFESFVEEDDFSDWSISYQSGGNNSGVYTGDDIDLFVTEVDSFSPTHSWTNVNETTGQVRHQYAGVFTPAQDPFAGDPIDLDFTMRAKYHVWPGQWFQPAFIASTYLWDVCDVTDYPLTTNRWPPINGDNGDINMGWHILSFSDLITTYTSYWEARYFGELGGLFDLINALNGRYGPDGLDVEDFTSLTFGAYYEADFVHSGAGYSGMYLDDFKLTKSYAGAERYTETIIVPFIAAGDCVDVEFVWEGVPTGNFIECKSVPPDDNNDNNELCGSFSVWTDIDCAIEEYVEPGDLTSAENHWTLCSSEYDSYFATGDCQYGADWFDPLQVTPDGEECIDMSGATSFTLDFDEYMQVEGLPYDYMTIEINPYACDPDGADYQWYQYDNLPIQVYYEDFESGIGAWTQTQYSGTGSWKAWNYGDSWMDAGYFPQGGNSYAGANSDNDATDVFDVEFFSPAIDMSTYPTYEIGYDFFAYPYYYPAEVLQVNIYSGGGMNFEETLADYSAGGWGTDSNVIDPTGYADPTQVYIGFYYNSYSVWAYGFLIDDVTVSGIDPSIPPDTTMGNHDWTHQTYTFGTGALNFFFNPQNGNSFASDIGGFTDQMGIRFVFYSDVDVQYRGVLLDDITFMVDSDVLIDADPAENFDNFMPMPALVGNYWEFVPDSPDYWMCKEQIGNYLPNNLNNELVWETGVPQAMKAMLTFEHNFVLMPNDYAYLEFSDDGGATWTAPTRFTGDSGGWQTVELDMTSFIGDDILIRWRVVTNETEKSEFYMVREMCITAQVDLVAPTTIGTLSGTMVYGWYSSAVTFTAVATDDVSGVAATYYKIDGGNALTYTGPVSISTNGQHQIEYWSVDKVGNEEVHKFTPSFKIDRGAAPSVSITGPDAGIYLFGNKILGFGSKPIIIGGFTVTATASDSDSGVYRLQFSLDGELFGEDTSTPYSAYCGLKHTGAGTITVVAQDFVGNSAQDTLDITYFKFL